MGGSDGAAAAAAAERSERRDRDRSLKGNGETGVSKGRKGRVGGWPPTAKKTKKYCHNRFVSYLFSPKIITPNITTIIPVLGVI